MEEYRCVGVLMPISLPYMQVRYYLHKPEEPGTWVAVMECKNTRVHLSESELTVWVENYQESEAEQALQDLKGRKRKPTQLEIDSPEKAQRRGEW
jgi:hypothetical protein